MTQTPTAKKSVQLSGIVVAESSVSSIDPDAGVLMYRGYDIADIAEHSTYEDTAYLLLHGDLPDAPARDAFRRELSERALPAAVQHAVDESAATGDTDGDGAHRRVDALVRLRGAGRDRS